MKREYKCSSELCEMRAVFLPPSIISSYEIGRKQPRVKSAVREHQKLKYKLKRETKVGQARSVGCTFIATTFFSDRVL